MTTSPPMTIPAETAYSTEYDVAIVGSGVSGAVIAKALGARACGCWWSRPGPAATSPSPTTRKASSASIPRVGKDNNAAYALNADAPMPRDYHTVKLHDGQPNDRGYLVQRGPLEIDSTYSRVLGGTTRHWEAKALRMVPDDFAMRATFGRGRDWPVSYDELEPYYQAAERELGVSGDVEDQCYAGLRFPEGYVLPMHRMPPSWLDQQMAKDLDGMEVALGDDRFEVKVRSTPQARNGVPNRAYDGGKGYRPTGAVALHQADFGERCQGNTNCVPICPVQAKYDARRTLFAALATGNVELLGATVATRVEVDGATGRVTGVRCLSYLGRDRAESVEGTIRAKTFVLAANAVENAAPDARLRPRRPRRADGPQPDGPCLSPDLGADAARRWAPAEARSAPRASRTCARAATAPVRPRCASRSTTTAGAGRQARPTPISTS